MSTTFYVCLKLNCVRHRTVLSASSFCSSSVCSPDDSFKRVRHEYYFSVCSVEVSNKYVNSIASRRNYFIFSVFVFV